MRIVLLNTPAGTLIATIESTGGAEPEFTDDEGVDSYRAFTEAVQPLITKAGGDVSSR